MRNINCSSVSLTSWPYLEQMLLLQGTTEKRKRININDLVMSSTFPHWHMSVRVSNTRCSPAVQGNIINQAHWINNKSSTWALILLPRLASGGSPERDRDAASSYIFWLDYGEKSRQHGNGIVSETILLFSRPLPYKIYNLWLIYWGGGGVEGWNSSQIPCEHALLTMWYHLRDDDSKTSLRGLVMIKTKSWLSDFLTVLALSFNLQEKANNRGTWSENAYDLEGAGICRQTTCQSTFYITYNGVKILLCIIVYSIKN
jgi:hypothetical protein